MSSSADKMKVFLGIFSLTVLFGEISCDVGCFIDKQIPRVTELINKGIAFNLAACRPARNYFEGSRDDAKSCSLKKISVEEALTFTKDLCTVGWDLNNKYLVQEQCFGANINNAKECIQNFPKMDPEKKIDDAKKACGVLDGIYKCFNDKVGKPCGDVGLELTQSLTKAVKSYTSGICAEVNGATTVALHWSLLLGYASALVIWYKY